MSEEGVAGMRISEEDLQRSYTVWDLFDTTRNHLAAMLRQEDLFLDDGLDRIQVTVKMGQTRRHRA